MFACFVFFFFALIPVVDCLAFASMILHWSRLMDLGMTLMGVPYDDWFWGFFLCGGVYGILGMDDH